MNQPSVQTCWSCMPAFPVDEDAVCCRFSTAARRHHEGQRVVSDQRRFQCASRSSIKQPACSIPRGACAKHGRKVGDASSRVRTEPFRGCHLPMLGYMRWPCRLVNCSPALTASLLRVSMWRRWHPQSPSPRPGAANPKRKLYSSPGEQELCFIASSSRTDRN